jgi:hypothetical protein
MGYELQNSIGTQAAPASLLTDSGRLIERLSDIHSRAIKVGNTLHGSQPRDAGGKSPSPEPESTLRRNLDRTHTLLNEIEAEFCRIEDRL